MFMFAYFLGKSSGQYAVRFGSRRKFIDTIVASACFIQLKIDLESHLAD